MEPALTDDLYERFRDLLRERLGLSYPDRKREDLAYGLRAVLRDAGYANMAALYADATSGGAAWDHLATHLTIGETYFFRNTPQFAAMREQILPELFARRAASRSLRFWSAGCATGEEPYSLAMLLVDTLPLGPWQTSILATDLNPHFLQRAREGLYGSWSFRETTEDQRSRFFQPDDGRWRIDPSIRRMVHFTQLNLAEASYPAIVNGTAAMDLILCRNVTIYFDEATTRQVASRLYDALTPGGWLIVGHAEPQASVYHQFEAINFPDTVVYRKPLDAPLFPSIAPAGARAALNQPARIQPAYRGLPVSATPPAPAPESQVRTLLAPESRRVGVPDVAALVKLAQGCADRGEWREAEAYCRQAIEQNPLSIEAHYLSALIHEHEGWLEDALAAYRRVVYLDRAAVLGLIGMARVWRQMGRLAEARRSYRNAQRQLAQLPPGVSFASGDGATAAELATHVAQALRELERAAPA